MLRGSTTTMTVMTRAQAAAAAAAVKQQRRGISSSPQQQLFTPPRNNQQKPPLIPCPTLTAALPRLRALFAKKSNSSDGVFPLFSPSVTKRIWENVEKNNKSNEGETEKRRRRRQAAILVPLVSLQDVGPSLLFTVRASHLTTQAAEVAFPGGHFDDGSSNSDNDDADGAALVGDVTLEDTAIREAKEELLGHEYPWHADKQGGDDDDHADVAAGVEILGRATALPSITGTSVTPIIAVLPYIISNDTFPGNKQEVKEIFYVSLKDLVKMETMEPSPRFQSDIPAYPVGPGKKIWGLTAVVTRPILHKLFKPVVLPSADNNVKQES